MAGRGMHYASHGSRQARRPQLRKASGGPVVIGTAYNMEQIQELVSWLASIKPDLQLQGLVEFFEHPAEISEGLSKMPELSNIGFMDLVISAVIKTEQILLPKLEAENAASALAFISQSSYFPSRLKENAAAALRRLEPEKKPEKMGILTSLLAPKMYSPQKVEDLIKRLGSASPKMAVPAALEFISNYSIIIPTVSRMPLLSVTEVTSHAVRVVKKHEDETFALLIRKRLLAELVFISSLSQFPLHIRKRAEETASRLQKEQRPVPGTTYGSKKKEALPLAPGAPVYPPARLSQLIEKLGSTEPRQVTAAAVEFLKNYGAIIQAVSSTPLLTVTDVTEKAIKAIKDNLDPVLLVLERGKEFRALELLASSHLFPLDVRARAEALLKKLGRLPAKPKNPRLQCFSTFFGPL